MLIELLNHAPGPPLSKVFSQFQLDEALRHGPDGEKHDGDAKENQERIKDPAGMAERMDLGVPDRGDSDQGHVKGVEQRIAFDDRESDRSHDKRQRDTGSDIREAAQQRLHRWI